MASKVPVIRAISFVSFLPHFVVVVCSILFWKWMGFESYLFLGPLTYLTISQLVSRGVPSDHRKGMQNVRAEAFEEAIPYFESSHAYFSKNTWIDDYRFITMLSHSKMSYREMALVNIAFCHTQIGRTQEAKEMYEDILVAYPDNTIAKTALRMIEGMS